MILLYEKKLPTLEARVYKIDHNFNDYTYYISYMNLTGKYKWYVTLNMNDPSPWCSEFMQGSETAEEAFSAWKKYATKFQ